MAETHDKAWQDMETRKKIEEARYAAGIAGTDASPDAGFARNYTARDPNGSLLDHLFTYHSPTLDQVQNYAAIRSAARYFAQVLIDNTPGGADQSAAIRKLRECVMTANASVALRGRS